MVEGLQFLLRTSMYAQRGDRDLILKEWIEGGGGGRWNASGSGKEGFELKAREGRGRKVRRVG